MSDLAMATDALTRAADVLLRTAGGRAVTLRMPAPAVPADPAEQLGLAVPEFQDVELAPVALRKARARVAEGRAARWELLVSAAVVEQVVGSLAFASASVLFRTAFGVLMDGVLYEMVSATAEQVFGQPYVYRVVMRAPLARVT